MAVPILVGCGHTNHRHDVSILERMSGSVQLVSPDGSYWLSVLNVLITDSLNRVPVSQPGIDVLVNPVTS